MAGIYGDELGVVREKVREETEDQGIKAARQGVPFFVVRRACSAASGCKSCPNLMEVKGSEAQGHHREEGLKEALSKDTGRWTRIGFEAYGVGRVGN